MDSRRLGQRIFDEGRRCREYSMEGMDSRRLGEEKAKAGDREYSMKAQVYSPREFPFQAVLSALNVHVLPFLVIYSHGIEPVIMCFHVCVCYIYICLYDIQTNIEDLQREIREENSFRTDLEVYVYIYDCT